MGIRCELKEPEILVIGVNFDQGKRNLVRVSGVFELSEFELTEYEWLESLVKSKGIETHFDLAGEFELFEFELPGLYCISVMQHILTHAKVAQTAVNYNNREDKKG